MSNTAASPILHLIRNMVEDEPCRELSDGELLRRFAGGHDEAAFHGLLRRHGAMVLHVCQTLLTDEQDAEDAFQATFLVLAQKATAVRKQSSISSWLYGVAYHTSLKARATRAARARRQRHEPRATVGTSQETSPADDLSWREVKQVLLAELNALADPYRLPLVLCYLEGETQDAAARLVGVSEATLKKRLERGREFLRMRLVRRGLGPAAALAASAWPDASLAGSLPPTLLSATAQAAATITGRTASVALLSPQVVALRAGVLRAMLVHRLKTIVVFMVVVGLAVAGVGLLSRQVVGALRFGSPAVGREVQDVAGADARPAGKRAKVIDAELHVIGYRGSGGVDKKAVDVEVRATAKPVVLVLTSYGAVDWQVKLTEGARIEEVIVSGYFPQEIEGVPKGVPLVNQSYFPNDGSRSKQGWFYPGEWNTPQWREMVRRLNDTTGLPVASYQEVSRGNSASVDGKRGVEHGQNGLTRRARAGKELTPKELLSVSKNARLHIIGISSPSIGNPGKPVEVEVRATAEPVVLVLTAEREAIWNVTRAKGARIKAVIVGSHRPQEVEGLPADVPVCYFSPDGSEYFFDKPRSRPARGTFAASQSNTLEYRRMVEKLNDLTGLPVSTFQAQAEYSAPFVIDERRGSDGAQKERIVRRPLPKEPSPAQLLAACEGADLHVVSIYGNDAGNGAPVDVEVQCTVKPVVLALASYYSVLWNVKIAPGARVKAVMIGGYFEQEFQGIPANVPLTYRAYFPSKNRDYYYAYQWNTIEYRRMLEKLNDMTGLLVRTSQVTSNGTDFVVDETRGSKYAQKERKARMPLSPEPTSKEFRARCAGAGLHVVSMYQPAAGNGAPVDVEVRATTKPVVLALVSYYSVLWKVKIAKGAQVKAVVVGGYYEQEFEGIPQDIPLVYRSYFPSMKQDYMYGHEWGSSDCRQSVSKLNRLTGLPVSTFQGQYRGTSFVIDGTRGSELAQKGTPSALAQEKANEDEDPLADVVDILSRELKAADDPNKRYFLIGPRKKARPPAKGYGLVVIMPGGDGSADFHPFVKRIFKYALPEGYLVAQPVAHQWTPDQKIVWPTKTNPVAGMKFSTEEFVDAVIEDVAKKQKVNAQRVFTLAWSSSGPAAYVVSLQEKPRVRGSLVAMSVFLPKTLPPLKRARGRAYYLYHSPDDRVCPYRMAEQAKTSLTDHGARVRLETYAGGHGWRGNVYQNIRKGIEWLEKDK
jgi:RNA polymerase sigma factor (sigma-70 family)